MGGADAGAYAALACGVATVAILCWWLLPVLVHRKNNASLAWVLLVFSGGALLSLFSVAKSTGQMSWFQFGLGDGFSVAGVRISTQWQYCCVWFYQILRCVLGCIVSDVFRPQIIKIQGQIETPAAHELRLLQFANTACTVFAFIVTISDIFIFLEKLDLTCGSLVVTCAMDLYCTHLLTANARRKREEAGEPVSKMGLLLRGSALASRWGGGRLLLDGTDSFTL